MSESVTVLSFTVPGPPVPQPRARVVQTGSGMVRAYDPERARNYKRHVGIVARGALSHLPYWSFEGQHALTVRVYRARRAGDLDNFVKGISDALNGIAWEDDSSVVELHAFMSDDSARPRVEVEVRCL